MLCYSTALVEGNFLWNNVITYTNNIRLFLSLSVTPKHLDEFEKIDLVESIIRQIYLNHENDRIYTVFPVKNSGR